VKGCLRPWRVTSAVVKPRASLCVASGALISISSPLAWLLRATDGLAGTLPYLEPM